MMTKSRALARARMLLGPNAHVSTSTRTRRDLYHPEVPAKPTVEYDIGEVLGTGGFLANHIRASGKTWEEALERCELYVRGVSVQLFAEELDAILSTATIPEACRARLLPYLAYAKERDSRAR